MFRTHKWSGLWGIPGGKVRYGEPCVEALRRELKEETNLEVDNIRFVLVQDCIGSTEFYREAHFVLLNYTCQAQEPLDVKLNEEAQESRWVSLAGASASGTVSVSLMPPPVRPVPRLPLRPVRRGARPYSITTSSMLGGRRLSLSRKTNGRAATQTHIISQKSSR